jgi:hypothetical protein
MCLLLIKEKVPNEIAKNLISILTYLTVLRLLLDEGDHVRILILTVLKNSQLLMG